MMQCPFYWVDAFTDEPLGGNPCAVVLDADGLDDSRMQAVAREMNLSETAFVMRSRVAHARARYFTTHTEIPMAGHPTISSLFALADAGRIELDADSVHLELELEVGPIPVELRSRAGRAVAVVMSQKSPRFLDAPMWPQVVEALGLSASDLLPGAPVQIVSTGTPQLQVAVKDLETLARVSVDGSRYRALHGQGAFFSAHVFCLQGATAGGDTFARHFGNPDGSNEDPFTGSATGGMGAYLWRHGLIDRPRFIAEQGHWLGRPGRAEVEVVGPPAAIETVRVGGTARVLVRGAIEL